MPVDFNELQEAVTVAQREAEEAQAAQAALAAVNEQLTQVQQLVSAAIETANRESEERVAALQRIIDLIQAGI